MNALNGLEMLIPCCLSTKVPDLRNMLALAINLTSSLYRIKKMKRCGLTTQDN